MDRPRNREREREEATNARCVLTFPFFLFISPGQQKTNSLCFVRTVGHSRLQCLVLIGKLPQLPGTSSLLPVRSLLYCVNRHSLIVSLQLPLRHIQRILLYTSFLWASGKFLIDERIILRETNQVAARNGLFSHRLDVHCARTHRILSVVRCAS